MRKFLFLASLLLLPSCDRNTGEVHVLAVCYRGDVHVTTPSRTITRSFDLAWDTTFTIDRPMQFRITVDHIIRHAEDDHPHVGLWFENEQMGGDWNTERMSDRPLKYEVFLDPGQ